MTQTMNLAASKRQETLKDLKDWLPAVVYGSGIETTSLTVKRSDFEKVFAQAGESGLIALKIDDGQDWPVIVKDLQTDAVKHRIIHVDFYKVSMTEKVTAEVTLSFVGEAPAVKTMGGIMVEHMDQLEIECLPADLVQRIEIDISGLENIGDAIQVKDIILPKGLTAKANPDEIVVNAVEPKKVVEEVPVVPAEGEAAAEAAPTEGETNAKVEEGKEAKPEEKAKEKK